MNKNEKVLRFVTRTLTFVSVAALVADVVDATLPIQDMPKLAKVSVVFGTAAIAYAAGYHVSMFTEKVWDGTVFDDILNGHE